MDRTFFTLGSLSALISVAAGAFGAHGLRGHLDAQALGTFETEWWDVKWDGLSLWGLYHGTVYGNAPYEDIPVLFVRPITQGECYFYPAPGVPGGGSPGCP